MAAKPSTSSGAKSRAVASRRRPLPEDPIARFGRWFERAQLKGVPQPEAMVLATADRQGRASARFVLLKQVDDRGFAFYTDRRSRKGRELARNPRAAAVFYWYALHTQVRIEGRVEPVSPADTDEYWASRPRDSQLGASVSKQSRRLSSRERMLADYVALKDRLKGKAVPRPSYWIGFRVAPDRIEFWHSGPHRLHDRVLFIRARGKWQKRLLYP